MSLIILTAGWSDLTNVGGYSGATAATLSVNTTGNFGAGTKRCKISGTAVNDVFTTLVTITVNANPSTPTTTGNVSCVAASFALSAIVSMMLLLEEQQKKPTIHF